MLFYFRFGFGEGALAKVNDVSGTSHWIKTLGQTLWRDYDTLLASEGLVITQEESGLTCSTRSSRKKINSLL